MTEDQFFNGDAYLVVAYKEKYRLEKEVRNQNMWWQGAYFREASLSALSGALYWIKKPYKYPQEAFRTEPTTEKEREALAIKEREKAIRQLSAWKDAWDRNAKQ